MSFLTFPCQPGGVSERLSGAQSPAGVQPQQHLQEEPFLGSAKPPRAHTTPARSRLGLSGAGVGVRPQQPLAGCPAKTWQPPPVPGRPSAPPQALASPGRVTPGEAAGAPRGFGGFCRGTPALLSPRATPLAPFLTRNEGWCAALSGWPSGLRRCVQVAVSPGGVGSNPTSDSSLLGLHLVMGLQRCSSRASPVQHVYTRSPRRS